MNYNKKHPSYLEKNNKKPISKLIHYRQRRVSCNACVEIAFDQWRMSKKDGKAVLLGGKEKRLSSEHSLRRSRR